MAKKFVSDDPRLLSEWHPTKNGDLSPDSVTAGSHKRVWWLCGKGHEWETITKSRAKDGNGCPFCSGHRVCSDNSLQTLWPELSEQWHPTKNGDLTPNDVTAGSNKKVWWKCEQGHEWRAVIYSRCKVKSLGCPICNQGRQTSFPEQAIYFYLKNVFNDTLNRHKHNDKWEIDVFIPSLNFGIEYDGIFFHRNKKTSDSKKEKHIASQGIHLLRIKEVEEKITKCYCEESIIYCSESPSETQLNEIIKACFDYISKNITHKLYVADIDVERDRATIYDLYIKTEEAESLFAKYPELSAQWHPIKNLSIKPNMVRYGSGKKVWWQCEKEHEWEETISNRIAGRNCPFCSGKRACADNCLQTLNPNLSEQWHPTKNSLAPSDVTTNSNKKVWWKCEKGHEWQESIVNRSKGSGCPYCSGKRACAENCLQTLDPDLAKQWHPAKNGNLTPRDVTMGSGGKVWWRCEKGHEWEAAIYSRVKGNGCPFCSGWRACVDNCLQALNPDLAKQWHPVKNGNLTPNDVTAGSKKKVWWQCEKGHEWESAVSGRNKGVGCPYCSGNRVCADNCLQTVNPILSKQWHPNKNGDLTPNDITAGSGKKVWWKCGNGHEWEATIYNRVKGNGCPFCSGRFVWTENSP